MWIGTLELDFLLGDVHSLKQKRSVVRPLIADIRRRCDVSVAETGHRDLHRRTELGVAVVSADREHVVEILDIVERLAAARPEVQLLSARPRYFSSEDL
ncbi:hypothetical protein GOHSU_02_01840 [Gordonia hirsuta DSM 44140 = NBRC 16056]|uniref:YlxP-like protein n=1 Tax=Gordonia hirsuta DSM 44140 = NBRC 16056 TaxID=1121927 RepID=L7L7M5_9ACTN|nr:DUF503 domain-containing protein [Gordonia hirsuta]GAC56037.1 hypothetical protein GOHSU_02_01840 [Gordonia hirsuta DSM 44140 = NBRC 16056]